MRDRILSEIRRLSALNGNNPPGRATFEKATGIKQSEWLGKFWSKWSAAVAEAGFEPQRFVQRRDTEELFPYLVAAFRHLGKVPTKAELLLYRKDHPDFPWHSSLEKHFRSKAQMVEALRAWLRGREGFDDVLSLLPEGSEPRSDVETSVASEGYVYLIKSGDYFKIGRGEQLEKRVKQIKTALPDAAVLEHAIRTDDPSGIEAYWHRRFADKRANGEWFRLSSVDVKAFKRRKYQ